MAEHARTLYSNQPTTQHGEARTAAARAMEFAVIWRAYRHPAAAAVTAGHFAPVTVVCCGGLCDVLDRAARTLRVHRRERERERGPRRRRLQSSVSLVVFCAIYYHHRRCSIALHNQKLYSVAACCPVMSLLREIAAGERERGVLENARKIASVRVGGLGAVFGILRKRNA